MSAHLLNIPPPGAYLLLVSLPLLVLSEFKSRSHAGTGLFKMLSSIAFLIGPLQSSTDWTQYRTLVTTGLLFSLAGDFFLIPSRGEFYNSKSSSDNAPSPKSARQENDISLSFQLGIVAFALAHVAYIAAFLQDSRETSWTIFATTFAATIVLSKWLGVIYPPPHFSTVGNVLDLAISADMKPLVFTYAVIISSMFAAAASTTPLDLSTAWRHQRLLGAGMFVVSDVFVAKNAFGRSSVPQHRGWFRIALGYGLYFWGQMVIAGTVEI